MAAVNELLWFFLSLALSPYPEKPTTQIGGWSVEPVTQSISVTESWDTGETPRYVLGDEGHCNRDEVWSDCEAHCQKNCSNWQQEVIICTKICIPGCVCKEGMVRGNKGYCVRPQAECSEPNYRHGLPTESEPPVTENLVRTPPPQNAGHCNRDEEWSDCDAHCQKNCSNWQQEVVICPRICIPGCVCKEGKVRGNKGYCVRPQAECSEPNDRHSLPEGSEPPVTENLVRTTPPQSAGNCNRDEFWSPCGAHCQKNCSNWQEKDIPCLRICVPGCVCKEGKVRGYKGYCVRPQAECSEPNARHDGNPFWSL